MMMDKGEIVQMLGEASDRLFVAATNVSHVNMSSGLVMYDEVRKIDEVRASLRKISDRIEKEMMEERDE